MRPEDGRDFLAAIAMRREIDAREVAVVVAHPDDETVGGGLLLTRLKGVLLVVATDGAPRDLTDARACGFGTAESYAAAREKELFAALDTASVDAREVVLLRIPDRKAVENLPVLSGAVRGLMERHRIRFAVTHAYEGGHPDHDAVAFAVGKVAPAAIVEMPFYRFGDNGLVLQSFTDGLGLTEVVVRAHRSERELKARMLAAYATKTSTLGPFSTEAERFRFAPAYDFREPANGGRIYYETQPWGVTRQDWRNAVDRE